MQNPNQTCILVPQGAEFQAVQRGLRHADRASFRLVAIPAGLQSVKQFLTNYDYDWQLVDRVIVMGLCGSLTPNLSVGDVVIYDSCQNLAQQVWQCSADKSNSAIAVRAVSSDSMIATVADKRAMRLQSDCAVVDMEGTAILDFFAALNIPVTMLRVISDSATEDIPDLSQAIDDEGNLQPLALALGLIREPLKGLRLIRGSLRGLKALEEIAGQIKTEI